MASRRHHRCTPQQPRRQRGAAALFAAVAFGALLAALALVIDIGNLYFAQRDLQNKANLAALDAVRTASGCYGPVTDPAAAAQQEAVASLLRNGGDADLLRQPAAIGSPAVAPDGLRFFQPGSGAERFAAEVLLQRPMPRRLLGGDDDSRSLRAGAAAMVANDVAISVGSFGARVSPTAPGALLDALPGEVDAALLDYGALLDANISVDEIFEPGSVQEILTQIREETELPTFLDAIGEILGAAGELAAATTVGAVAAATDVTQVFVPAEIINLDNNIAPLLDGAAISAAAVVESAIQGVLVDGVIELLIQLGGGREVEVTLREEAQFDIGPPGTRPGGEQITESRTAQGRLRAALPLDFLPTGTEIGLIAETIGARAAVTGLRCPSAANPQTEVRVRTTTSAAEIAIEPVEVEISLSALQSALGLSNGELFNLVGGNGGLLCGLLGLLGPLGNSLCSLLSLDPLLSLSVALPPVALPGGADERWVPGPFPQSYSVSAPPLAPVSGLVEPALDIQISVAGAPPSGAVGDLLNDLLAALQPLLRPLLAGAVADTLNAALMPVMADLGVSLIGADVTISSVAIRRPQLFLTVE